MMNAEARVGVRSNNLDRQESGMTTWKHPVFAVVFLMIQFLCFADSPQAKVGAGASAPLQPGRYRVELSGAVQGAFEGASRAFKMPGGDWGIQLVSPRKDPASESVLIVIPKNAAAGTSPIQGYEKVFAQDSTVTAVGATYTSSAFMGLHAEGTLKLDSVAPLFSGSFEFTVSTFGSDQKVTAKGAFSKLSVSK